MYLEQKQIVTYKLVVLSMSANQHIKPGLTRGKENARRPPACVYALFVTGKGASAIELWMLANSITRSQAYDSLGATCNPWG